MTTERGNNMNVKENRKKWVAALRSGEYKQGRLYLCHTDEEGQTTHCCLGVLCEIAGLQKKLNPTDDDKGVLTMYGSEDACSEVVAPHEIMDFVGLTTARGHFGDGDSLVRLNDYSFDFDHIADLIEREPDGLFKN